MNYEVKQNLKPINLSGISEKQIEQHWTLYQGYVTHVNTLNEELAVLRKQEKEKTTFYADRRRRYGFEYNGMVLHEYYFGNLTSKQETLPQGTLKTALENNWGSFENWKIDFHATAITRGIGWAILYADPSGNRLLNVFIEHHEHGLIAGFAPLLVLDVWEHAYLIDYEVTQRAKYINAFMDNINWTVIEQRYQKAF